MMRKMDCAGEYRFIACDSKQRGRRAPIWWFWLTVAGIVFSTVGGWVIQIYAARKK
jgi:hypothetical protein